MIDPNDALLRHQLCWGKLQDERLLTESLRAQVATLTAERAELITLLREVEWQGDISEGAGRPWCCPICMGSPDRGHAPDCRLAAFLR